MLNPELYLSIYPTIYIQVTLYRLLAKGSNYYKGSTITLWQLSDSLPCLKKTWLF